jgi:tetratricopeptide (TPR) repeat protein
MLLALAAVAVGDSLKSDGVPYPNVTIRDVKGGRVYFDGPSGAIVKRFDRVSYIEVSGAGRLTAAEKAFAERRYEEALDGYKEVASTASKPWMRLVAEVRLVTCYQQAGQLGKAVELYFRHFPKDPASLFGVEIGKPIGPKGSAGNADALVKLKALAATSTGKTLEKVNEVLRAVQAVEQAGAVPDPGPGDNGSGDPGPAPPAAGGRIKRIADLVQQGKNSDALTAIDKLRKEGARLGPVEIAELYFQEALARRQTAEGLARRAKQAADAGETRRAEQLTADAQAEFKRAGYTFLRLPLTGGISRVTKAPRALYEVGRIYRDHLGREDLARKCFEMVSKRYPNSPWTQRARDALRDL